jgi:uncharacterized protein YbcC (UPF0753/DUF2309 family)
VDDISSILHQLKHYLPSQAPLKDFIHHNTLHAFQHQKFHEGMQSAAEIFGYQVYLSIEEYRKMFNNGKINNELLNEHIIKQKGSEELNHWREKLLDKQYDTSFNQKIGALRNTWKTNYKINLDKYVHPILFRLIGSYIDQGISLDKFPKQNGGFLASIKALEQNSFIKLFKSDRVHILLHSKEPLLPRLLKLVVGDEKYYEQYLFDQQFAHPGWSGMVSFLEDNPVSLLDTRKISLEDAIILELLIEIDTLDEKFGETWKPIALHLDVPIEPLFKSSSYQELFEVYSIFQEAYEWTYYDEVLKGLQIQKANSIDSQKSFQAVFCIDDRECSLRRHLEKKDNNCETFSTAGFFNVAFYFQPEHGKFHTKSCPAPQFPNYLIQEFEATKRHKKDSHFSRNTYGFFGGFISAPTMGFWSALKMAKSILYPTQTEALVSSFKHMDKNGKLTIEAKADHKKIGDLQLGFTTSEMADKIEGLLKGIGLIADFAPLVYLIGHGASSVNNTHYAGYDCGACSGRAGSVNARVAAYMANKPSVREELKKRGIDIPNTTQFIGGLHDTTRDEVDFFDEDILSNQNKAMHEKNSVVFNQALHKNAKERSRRFLLMDSKADAQQVHEKVKLRSLSLFEPRPEWNHATNTLCIIGKRENNKHLFFDRRAFLNSYDYSIDADGVILLGILNAVAPVCGGINLEYYFSRIDNYRLGAGTKLPHNVMGLIGVANGMDGDLRTGLPKQMINIHDPLRLLVTVEHFPEVVLKTILVNPSTYEWFKNEWIHLVVIHPENKTLFAFKDGKFTPYTLLTKEIKVIEDLEKLFENEEGNLPVYQLN